jgi:MIP family channel proteins
MPVRLGAALVAEFVGSFCLTFIGIMAIHASAGMPGGVGLIAVAIAHGLALAIMVTACMPTSGGHINPAITVGFLITGKIKPVAGIAYIVLQCLGGVVAALAVYVIFGGDMKGAQVVLDGTPHISVSSGIALMCEIIATFFLGFAVWGTAADPRARDVGGFAIGLTIAMDVLAVGPLTGASMNPQRSFGPTLIASFSDNGAALWATHWIYWVGPIVGASLAALVYNLALWPRTPRVEPGAVDVPPTQRP